jgi:chromosome partitioning protein
MKNSKAKIIAVANQKGGVAKTTSVINIGAGLALKGKKVLLVDTDNQSHLSRFLGYDGTDGNPTISELIFQTVSKVQKPVSEAIRKSELGVDYIPSNFMLAGIISILGTDSDSTGVFSRLFSDGTFDEYDYIIIDCPPTLDLLVSNALKACDKVLIPVQSDYWAYEGVDQILATLQRAKQTSDIKPYVLGMLVTMYNKRTNSARAIMDAMNESYGEYVFENAIAFRDEVKVATIEHKTLVGKKNSITGQQYMAVAEEIIGKEGQANG